MTTIKGPLKFSGGFNAKAFMKSKLGERDSVKLPFEAHGWKSTKNPVVIEDGKDEAKLTQEKKDEMKGKVKVAVIEIVQEEQLGKEKGFVGKFIDKVRSL